MVRVSLVLLLGFSALWFSACDPGSGSLTVRNTLQHGTVLRVLNSIGDTNRIAKPGDGTWQNAIQLKAGEETTVLIAGPPGGPYTVVIEELAGQELFLRTFYAKELVERKWRIVITEQGIQ